MKYLLLIAAVALMVDMLRAPRKNRKFSAHDAKGASSDVANALVSKTLQSALDAIGKARLERASGMAVFVIINEGEKTHGVWLTNGVFDVPVMAEITDECARRIKDSYAEGNGAHRLQ